MIDSTQRKTLQEAIIHGASYRLAICDRHPNSLPALTGRVRFRIPTRPVLFISQWSAGNLVDQCENRIGTVIDSSRVFEVPPSIHSRTRLRL